MNKNNLYYVAWVISLAALIGSFYFSDGIGLTPCLLCWYQRIFMFPLPILILVGILRRDINLPRYILPMSVLGGLIGLFQWLLQMKVIPSGLAPCVNGISCESIDWSILGFVTIPFLSLLAFIGISVSMYLALRRS